MEVQFHRRITMQFNHLTATVVIWVQL